MAERRIGVENLCISRKIVVYKLRSRIFISVIVEKMCHYVSELVTYFYSKICSEMFLCATSPVVMLHLGI